MVPLDKHDLTMLHILQNKVIASKAIKAAKRGMDLFPARQRPHLDLLWTEFIIHAAESRKTGKWLEWDRQSFVAACLERLKSSEMLDENKARLQAICEQYVSQTPLEQAQGEAYLKEEINECIQRQIARAISGSDAFNAVRKLIGEGEKLHEELRTDAEKVPLFVNPLLNVERYLKRLPKLASGVKYFDKATNGGLSEGEIALVAGVTGGGKTVCTVELVGSQLLMGNDVAWFTYEQPFDQDIMQRLVTYITGYSLDMVRGLEFQMLPDSVRSKFMQVANQAADKMMAADFSTSEMLDPDDPEDDLSGYSIRKRLDIWLSQGKSPAYVVVDWLGAAVKNVAGRRGIDIGQVTSYIALANEIITDLVQVAKTYKTRVVFFHQLDPAIKKSPPSRKPTTVELQMMKSITNWVNYAMAIGRRDSNERCWFICDKCRNGLSSESVLELDGAHAKFNLLEGYAPGRNGQFINVNELQEELSDNIDTASSYQPVV